MDPKGDLVMVFNASQTSFRFVHWEKVGAKSSKESIKNVSYTEKKKKKSQKMDNERGVKLPVRHGGGDCRWPFMCHSARV